MSAEPAPGLLPPGLIDRRRLASDLRSLGLRRGQDLLVHCSLRRVGPVDGGAAALLNAIVDVAGAEATIMVPTHTAQNSLTSRAFREATAGLDARARARYIAGMPGFDPASTPSSGMGALAEYVRTRPTACRSRHPQVSFAAVGPAARVCTAVHDLDCHLGDRSPVGWLYANDGAILLLGVGYSVCTAFHLAEYHLPGTAPRRTYQCFVADGKQRIKHQFTDLDLDDSDFGSLGADLEFASGLNSAYGLRKGLVGRAESRVVPARSAVDFAGPWLATYRGRVIS